MTLVDGGGGPPLKLGYVRAIDRAVELRGLGLTYPAIAIVMHAYHGIGHRGEWWRQECAKRGVAVRASSRNFNGPLYTTDKRVLEALKEAPLTILQLRYKLTGHRLSVDKIDRSLRRLVERGYVTADAGRGLERRWRAR